MFVKCIHCIVLSLASPSGYENSFAFGPVTSLGGGLYTATLSQVQAVTRNNLASGNGIVTITVEASK